MAEGAARIDAVALEPVPAARAEPRALAVPELAIRPLQPKPQTYTQEARIRSTTKPTNEPPRWLPAACRCRNAKPLEMAAPD